MWQEILHLYNVSNWLSWYSEAMLPLLVKCNLGKTGLASETVPVDLTAVQYLFLRIPGIYLYVIFHKHPEKWGVWYPSPKSVGILP